LDFIHLIVIIYSCFFVPFQAGFSIDYDVFLIVIESFCIVESLLYLIVNFRGSVFLKDRKLMSLKDILSFYYRNHMLEDVLACSPFNLIFGAL
jgi:hypothetical protein